MSIISKASVKATFETGDKPTAAQFVDFIDSCIRDSMVAIATAAEGGATGVIEITGSTAVTLLSLGAVGREVFHAATTASAQGHLGAGAVGIEVLEAITTASARNHLGIADAGTVVRWSKGADIASATALTPGTDGNFFDVTGTTTITSIAALGVGTLIGLQFDGALTLTHDATNLILPGGANITTAAGDIAYCYEYAAGDWRVAFVPATGLPVKANKLSELTSYFKSSNQTVAADTKLDVAHGLGAVPEGVLVSMVCTTADLNYSVGDEIFVNGTQHNPTDSGFLVVADATNVSITQGATITGLDASSFNTTTLTLASWRWVVRAWL